MPMNFSRFHKTWTEQLHQLAKTTAHPNSPNDHTQDRHLVDKIVTHYNDYYTAKAAVAVSDVLALFAAPWASALERALYWVGGFRPTTIFHLVYTESSVRFESRVMEILRGKRTGDLGELSPGQLGRVSELQCMTVKEENEIGDELCAWQEAVTRAEPDWAGLCGNSSNNGLDGLLGGLGRVLAKADELRLQTIRRVVELLTPQQAIEFLIAVAELQYGIGEWGSHHDTAVAA